MQPLIKTFTGKHVNPLDLRPEDIDIRDIAHALACCNRFAGHARKPINVAQHSVYVARIVETICSPLDEMGFPQEENRKIVVQALLHDASEAYLGDVTKWLKATPAMAGYREAEERIQTQIYERFGVSTRQHEIVTLADKMMLRFEGPLAFGEKGWAAWREFLPPGYGPIDAGERAIINGWGFWSWRVSEEAFLVSARLLGLLEGAEEEEELSGSEAQRSEAGRTKPRPEVLGS